MDRGWHSGLNMKVQFQRTGGFGGIRLSVVLDTDEILIEEATQLRRLVLKSSFFDHSGAGLRSASPMPDQFQYWISVEEGDKKKEITIYETAMPKRLRPLVDHLLEQSRKGRGKK